MQINSFTEWDELKSIMIGLEEISLVKLFTNTINITAVLYNSRFFIYKNG
mgnify:CR=1 FL=1